MIPGAWYDLSSRISHAQAVATCMGESMPFVPGNETLYRSISRLSELVGAIDDILTLAARDVEELERQLNAPG
ncbi:MAG: hypothetical protein ACYCY1_12505 [Sulfuriferula sp.]